MNVVDGKTGELCDYRQEGFMYTRRVLLLLTAALAGLGPVSAQAPGRRFLIVLIGPTGSGKTTQSEFLKKEYGIPTVNIDDLIKENPEALAKYNETGIDPGVPQSNPAISELVADRLSKLDLSKGVALDGYPATKDQADHLASLAKKFSLAAPVVIQLDVPDEVVRERLHKRAREDDTSAQIEARLKEYHRELDMVQAYYPKADIWTVDGTGTPLEVSKTIRAILEDELKK
jgi:adenylate kinase